MRSFVNTILTHVPKPATWALEETRPEGCLHWLGPDAPKKMKHNFCRNYRFKSSVCGDLKVSFIRNDHLQVREA